MKNRRIYLTKKERAELDSGNPVTKHIRSSKIKLKIFPLQR